MSMSSRVQRRLQKKLERKRARQMQKTNGAAPIGRVNLTPQQAVVVCALERLLVAMNAEISQLDQMWGQKEVAAKLVDAAKLIQNQRDEFMKSVSPIVLANQIPSGIVPG